MPGQRISRNSWNNCLVSVKSNWRNQKLFFHSRMKICEIGFDGNYLQFPYYWFKGIHQNETMVSMKTTEMKNRFEWNPRTCMQIDRFLFLSASFGFFPVFSLNQHLPACTDKLFTNPIHMYDLHICLAKVDENEAMSQCSLQKWHFYGSKIFQVIHMHNQQWSH